MKRSLFACLASITLSLLPQFSRADVIPLSSLDLTLMSTGWGKAQANKSITGKSLRIGTQEFATGVGSHADSEFHIDLAGRAERFQALVGVDAAASNDRALLEFSIYGDGKELWRSGPCKLNQPPRPCDIPLKGINTLSLFVTDAGNGIDFDHADWADAKITFTGTAPKALPAPREEAVILTPPPAPTPRLNNPKRYGVRPNSPFLFRIPVTGQRPMTFAAENLPAGLSLDPQTGIITGKVSVPGDHKVTLVAKNSLGETRRDFTIVVGNTLALTPPMGWNSWYIHYDRISDQGMRAAADAMISSGMADFGYQYVNIDDCWPVKPGAKDPVIGGPARDASGRLLTNKRFPDMKALTDYIHAKGLKAGIYTSPGPLTCAGYEGAYQHEALDARTFAEWGFDFLKYDWCSYGQVAGGNKREHFVKPYKLMWDELQKLDRDIVFNLCQYGMDNVWEWGGQVGHCWRTTGDLGLEGGQLSTGIFKVGLFNAALSDYARPGQWNDPDYILIGWVGNASQMGAGRPTTLTPNEQYTHMSMWALMAAPLIFSGDMTKLDPFTLNILCNAEVIEIDQDPLGRQARIVKKTSDVLILAKDLEDGSKALGLFNLSPVSAKITADFSSLNLSGSHHLTHVEGRPGHLEPHGLLLGSRVPSWAGAHRGETP
ncbi:MAG: NPCBM/NEW2 domain-containing protein, partial [Bacillota bacterium]